MKASEVVTIPGVVLRHRESGLALCAFASWREILSRKGAKAQRCRREKWES